MTTDRQIQSDLMQLKSRIFAANNDADRKQATTCNDLWNRLCNDKPPADDSAAFVFVLNRDAPLSTLEYLISTIKSRQLSVSLIGEPLANEDPSLLVSCEQEVLRLSAKHVYATQQLRRQNCEVGNENHLSIPEQERVLQYLLETIVQRERSTLVGLDDVTIYSGQSIVQIYHREHVIKNYFPLHQVDNLGNLKSKLCSAFVNEIDSVRNYFGEKIGFYFFFINTYCRFFACMSVLSLFAHFFGDVYLINELMVIVVSVGMFIFLKILKRESSILAFRWGTIQAFELDCARPAFRSKGMYRDPITDELVPFYPITKTWIKEYLISLPFVAVCLYVAFTIMCIYFDIENWMLRLCNEQPSLLITALSYCPSVAYALLVVIMNHLYCKVATKLNDYENHRTQDSHENHWIVKLVLFEFVNNFMSLFYIAFYLKDINMLRWNLITMLTVNQLADNILEVVLPLACIFLRSNRIKVKIDNDEKKACIDHAINQLFDYEDYYDYLELFIQYGYALLFVSIFPIAPIIAFVNGMIEIRLDAIKLCYTMRKPCQRSAKCVSNAWMKSFEVISILVVISNLLMLSLVSNPMRDWGVYFNLSTFEFTVIVEHLTLLLILLIWYIVPDVAKEVNHNLSRQKYNNIKEITSSKAFFAKASPFEQFG